MAAAILLFPPLRALGDPATWQMWRIVLKAGFGIVLNRDEARAFATIAGGRLRRRLCRLVGWSPHLTLAPIPIQ